MDTVICKLQKLYANKAEFAVTSHFQHDVVKQYSDFFLPIGTGNGTHIIGKNGVKIKPIGIFYQCTCNLKLISKEEKVRTRQDAFISLW